MPSVKMFRHQPGKARPSFSQLHQWVEKQTTSLKDMSKELAELTVDLQAEKKQSVLVIFQALDAAGKDSTIRNVFRYCDPSMISSQSFKTPSAKESSHDFMWRCYPHFPANGKVQIFNRSYYEETLVVRVHPHFLQNQHIDIPVKKSFWQQRFDFINQVEKHFTTNRTRVIKFMLDVDKDTQQQRLVRRYARSDKNWTFNINDLKERQFWDEYQLAFDDMLDKTSTEYAPWYVIPATDKNMMRQLVATIMVKQLKKMGFQRPGLAPMTDDELTLLSETIEATNQTE
ncbi:PPK2 family polyphosphate kinase [Marinicella gelatinilytica]|uniref:PPK2 family polyphosphate kinase n=1 Tax=Marinicella gelatinilytica TaxID=2996017 RepID=UPI002260A9B6|nr:PPK2 family polyphosphate kinase [Marinicella gelatinilytica]MCX7544812.1 polyphosphate kinase 2 family protein [Marinicella gelatinilytica]